jgi:hypothetical protein
MSDLTPERVAELRAEVDAMFVVFTREQIRVGQGQHLIKTRDLLALLDRLAEQDAEIATLKADHDAAIDVGGFAHTGYRCMESAVRDLVGELDRKDAEIARLRAPYPDNPGATHFDGCWRTRGHHNCAVAEVERVTADADALGSLLDTTTAELRAARAEVEALRGLLADAGVVISDHLAESYPVILDSIDAALSPKEPTP